MWFRFIPQPIPVRALEERKREQETTFHFISFHFAPHDQGLRTHDEHMRSVNAPARGCLLRDLRGGRVAGGSGESLTLAATCGSSDGSGCGDIDVFPYCDLQVLNQYQCVVQRGFVSRKLALKIGGVDTVHVVIRV
jgi:hypothetical protein